MNRTSEHRAGRRRGSFARSLKAVAWSFFGVRNSAAYERDVSELDPRHVVIAAIVAALVFVLALVALVDWVLSSGVAAS